MRLHPLTLAGASLAAGLAIACTDESSPTGAAGSDTPAFASSRAPGQSGVVVRSEETYGFSFFDIRRGLVVFASTHQGFEFCGEPVTLDILSDVHTVISPSAQNTFAQLVKGDAYVSVYTLTDEVFEDFCNFLVNGPKLGTGLLHFTANDNDLNFDGSTSNRTDVFGVQTEGRVQLSGGGSAHLSGGFRAHLSRSPSGEVSFDVPSSKIILSGRQ